MNINAFPQHCRALIFRDLPSNNVYNSNNSKRGKNYFLSIGTDRSEKTVQT